MITSQFYQLRNHRTNPILDNKMPATYDCIGVLIGLGNSDNWNNWVWPRWEFAKLRYADRCQSHVSELKNVANEETRPQSVTSGHGFS